MNAAVADLGGILGQVAGAMHTLLQQVESVNVSVEQLSLRINSQATALEETAAAMEVLMHNAQATTENMHKASRVADKARGEVNQSVIG